MNNIKAIILVAMLFVSIFPANATEIRGTVVTGAGTYTWTAQNFAGFQYDIDNDVLTSETMNVTVVDRTIPTGGLTYSTQKSLVNKTNHPEYYVVGWMGDKYVAVGGKTNKIAKLILDMNDEDKFTTTSGGTLNLGSGYVLKIQEVDARTSPRQAWIKLEKNGVTLDDGIVNEKQTYTYSTTVLGDEDVKIFSVYINSIFSGTEVDMLQLKYGWLIDKDSAKEIKVGDIFGVMEVTQASSDLVMLANDNSLSLSKNSEVTIMGNMKFKVANNNVLRYYPKVDVFGDNVTISSPVPTVTIVPLDVSPKVNCTPVTVEKIVEKTVTVTVVVTPEPTPIPTPIESPGFEAVFAITGLLAVAYIVLRQRK